MMQLTRLPALFQGRPVMIVAIDATSVLVADGDGDLRYLDHSAVQVSWHDDAEATIWMEFGGYAPDTDVAASDDTDADPGTDDSDTR